MQRQLVRRRQDLRSDRDGVERRQAELERSVGADGGRLGRRHNQDDHAVAAEAALEADAVLLGLHRVV